jgi:hypothetical protein
MMVFPRLLGSLRPRPDALKNVMTGGHERSLLDRCFTGRPTKRPCETAVRLSIPVIRDHFSYVHSQRFHCKRLCQDLHARFQVAIANDGGLRISGYE